MENYRPDRDGKNIYTIEVFLQAGKYKYSFTYEIQSHGVGGILDLDSSTLQGNLFNHLGFSDEVIDDLGSVELTLTDPETGKKVVQELEVGYEDEFEELFVGVMVVGCRPIE